MSFFKNALSVIPASNMLGLSTAMSMGESLLNNYEAKKQTKKAYERDLAFWNMQNEYNSPVNQMARLREAGLNPNLIYGQVNSGNSGYSMHSGTPQVSYGGILQGAKALMDLEAQAKQNKLLQYQNMVAKHDADIVTNPKNKDIMSDTLKNPLSAKSQGILDRTEAGMDFVTNLLGKMFGFTMSLPSNLYYMLKRGVSPESYYNTNGIYWY